MKVFVVIVTYNGEQWIHRCFSSLRNAGIPLTVIAVDNGSSDATVDIIKGFSEVQFIASGKNLGFGKANNLGIRLAMEQEADYLFLLNQDAWINSKTLPLLVSASRTNPQYGIISPLHFERDEKTFDRQFFNYISDARCPGLLNDMEHGSLKDIYPCGFVNAAGWLMTKACIHRVGLFEPKFQLYGEDQNFVQRMKFHGLKLGIVPQASMVHDRSERKGEKSENGKVIEVETFLLTRVLNVNNGLAKNVLNALKVFKRFGVNRRTVLRFLFMASRSLLWASRLKAYKKTGYLLHIP